MPLTPQQATDLATLGELADSIDRKLDDLKRSALRRTVLLVVAIVVVGLFTLTASASATRANDRAHRAEAALAAYKADTTRVRINACYQANTQQLDQAKIEKSNERARRKQSPAQQALTDQILAQLHISKAQVDRFNAEQLKFFDSQVDLAHRQRDCTAKGVEEYLSGSGGYLKPGQKNPPRPND